MIGKIQNCRLKNCDVRVIDRATDFPAAVTWTALPRKAVVELRSSAQRFIVWSLVQVEHQNGNRSSDNRQRRQQRPARGLHCNTGHLQYSVVPRRKPDASAIGGGGGKFPRITAAEMPEMHGRCVLATGVRTTIGRERRQNARDVVVADTGPGDKFWHTDRVPSNGQHATESRRSFSRLRRTQRLTLTISPYLPLSDETRRSTDLCHRAKCSLAAVTACKGSINPG